VELVQLIKQQLPLLRRQQRQAELQFALLKMNNAPVLALIRHVFKVEMALYGLLINNVNKVFLAIHQAIMYIAIEMKEN